MPDSTEVLCSQVVVVVVVAVVAYSTVVVVDCRSLASSFVVDHRSSEYDEDGERASSFADEVVVDVVVAYHSVPVVDCSIVVVVVEDAAEVDSHRDYDEYQMVVVVVVVDMDLVVVVVVRHHTCSVQ